MNNNLNSLENSKAQALLLIKQLDKERGSDVLAVPVKERPVTREILASASVVRIAFVRHVVETFGKLGARKQEIPAAIAWFHGKGVPEAAERVAQLILRRRLPFSDDILAEMLEQIAGMEFITFAPVLDQLVKELEKRASAGPLTNRIREAAVRIADGLLVKHWPEAAARNWGLPRAADRKLASRIECLLTGPLAL